MDCFHRGGSGGPIPSGREENRLRLYTFVQLRNLDVRKQWARSRAVNFARRPSCRKPAVVSGRPLDRLRRAQGRQSRHLRDQRRWRRAAPPDLRDCEQYTPELVRRCAVDLLQLESKRNRQIWKAPAQGGLAVQVTKSGGYEAFESPDGKLVY